MSARDNRKLTLEPPGNKLASNFRRPSSTGVHNQKPKVRIERAHTAKSSFISSDIDDEMDIVPIKSFRKAVDIMNNASTLRKTLKARIKGRGDSDNIIDDLGSLSDYDSMDDDDIIEKKQDYCIQTQYKTICNHLGSIPCHSYLRQMESTTANLSNCQLGINDIKAIAISLVNNSDIMELNLSGNTLGRTGLSYLSEVLRENVFITSLDLSSTDIEADGLKVLVHALLRNKTLTELNLAKNNLDNRSLDALANLIRRNDYIVNLNLSGNKIDELGGVQIASAIAANLTIKNLDLSWNQLRRKGASAVVKAICENGELEEVNLSFNGLAEEGARAFGSHLPNNHMLHTLDISNNRIHFSHFGFFLKGLKENDTLRNLKLSGNPISSDGAVALLKTFQASEKSTLQRIDIEDAPVEVSFLDTYRELEETKPLTVIHREIMQKAVKSVVRAPTLQDYDPVLLLFEYMRQENFRLIDLFRTFDTDNDQHITRQELKNGFTLMNITMTEEQIDQLIEKLDSDHSHTIELQEMKIGRRHAASLRHTANEKGRENFKDMLNHLNVLLKKSREEGLKEKAERRRNVRRRESVTAIIQFKPNHRL